MLKKYVCMIIVGFKRSLDLVLRERNNKELSMFLVKPLILVYRYLLFIYPFKFAFGHIIAIFLS